MLQLNFTVTIAQDKLQTGQYLISETGTAIVSLKGTDELLSVDSEPVLSIQDFEEAFVGYTQAPKGRSVGFINQTQPRRPAKVQGIYAAKHR